MAIRTPQYPLNFFGSEFGPPTVRGPGQSHETGPRPADLGAAQSLLAKQQHLALRHIDRTRDPVISLLRLALQCLQLAIEGLRPALRISNGMPLCQLAGYF